MVPAMTLEALENRVLLTVTGFQSAVNYTSGSGPHAVATGDFTNNGRSDLVVVNQTSGTVSVFLSNPNGTLQATATTLTDNAAPDAVAVGDFLDNGDEDIAVANHSNGTVSVWLGNGNGSFSAPATYSVGAGADAIASADLNGDGRDDLAVGTFTAGNVVVLLANSNGTTAANAFSISGTYSLGAGINGIAAGETSTDGFNDLAVSNVGGTVTVLHNNGSGQFTTSNSDVYNAGISPAGVVIGNFQEAGDIAVADNGDGTSGSANVTVLLNTDGTGDDYATDSSGPYLAGANPNSIVAANINGDGRMDLAVTDDTDNTISLLYNNNTGSGPIFAAPVTVATGTAPDSIAAGDFTGSGQVDLAVANKSSGNASVFLHSSISATGIAQTATEGTTLSGTTVATFTDNEANASAGDFTAQVNWGDGTTTTGSVSSANGSFYVTASHAYYDQGSYTVTVAVSDTNDDSAQATASATVADAALTATALTIAPTAGASFTGPVATFTDADPNGAAKFQNDPNQYAAIIAWGDGHSTAGVITDNSGTFDVSGTHTYTIYGTFSPHVTIEDEGGSTIAVTSTANVADAAIAASGTSITATEGGSFSGTIGTFTDANPFMGAGAFTATLHWGDGTTTTGTVINTGTGQFSITGTHTYGDAGSNTLSFTVSDLGGSSNSSSTSVQVNNATLGSALATINATEGTSYTSTVATFTDSNTSASANKFTALITWPDLTTSSGTVSGSGGSYAVTIPGGHTFAHAGSQAVSVLITGAGGSTTTASGNTTVANAAMAGTLATVTATEGTPFTGTLATFTDANTAAAAADFSSTITWDNNSTSSGTIVATGTPGTYAVTIPGGHTFTRTGSRAISIAISGAGGGTASASGNVTVDNQTITATASTISASNGNQFSGAVATFSDPNLGANHLDFSASINWGDTTTSAGIVHWVSPGNFVVDGTHTWANPGTPTVTVTITGAGGGSQGTSQNATVTDSPVSVTATANSVTEGQTFNGTIATFTDGNPSAVVGNFSSSIDWGDSSGADTSATITESNGVFSVVGTHAYSGAGTPTVSVSVTDNNSQTVTNGATMTVGYASVGATLATISATEGSAFSDTVATFTDANTSAPANQFLATIHWPGGSSTTGTIAQTSPGNFSVTGGFTFARAGSRPVSVDITDPTGVTSLATASGNATVTSAGVTVTGSSFEALQGFGRTGTVATFADAYSGSITPASAYSATITWDDSTTSPGTITSTGSGTYSITAGHIWETAGNGINYSISVTGPGMGSAATGTGTVAVDSRDLVATMSTITATEGTPFTGTVATFANNDTLALNPGTDYTATITWDDNTTSVGTVTALSGGEYSVTSTHTFNTPGIPTQSISITGPRVFSAVTASGAATVANAGVTVSAGSIAPTEGAPFTGTIGTFTDANTNTTGSAGSYTAAITWDDDTTDDATITALSNGAYSITDTHTFNDPGSQSYSISVSGPGMSTAATGTGSAAVVNAGISGTLSTITATEGSNWSGTVATFTDANSSSVGSPDGYVATITWDDNTTSPGVVSPIGQSGAYSITSNHTFQTPGSAAVSISVAGTYNGLASPASISGNATVQAATLDVTAAAPLAFTEGAADTNVTVATFTTADPSRVLGDFAATVNWGDNTGTDSGTTIVSLGNETYAVVATGHTYAQASGVPYQFTVNVTEGNSYQTQSDTGSADVAYATISNPTISTITATEGTPWTGTIGTFTDSNTSAAISEFQATITWADETQSSAGITQTSPGNFAVTINGHAFPDAGYSAVSIAILDDGGNQLSSDSDSVYIDNATVAVTGKTLSATSGNLFSGAIASFTDSNTLATSADFTATINWGDTTTSSGTAVTISQTSPGNFNVIAAHTFAPSNPYTITITVDGAGGAVESDTSSMTVADAPIAVTGNSVEATEASAYSGTIATFIDTDSTLNASNFASSIDWGDNTGADTSATITEVDSQTGLYAVVGTHTFDSAATFIPTVSVTHTTTVTSNSGAASVDVGYATIGSTLSTIAATEGTPWSGTVATFTDSNTAAPIGEFAATINWPGGVSTSTGTISSLGNGEYAVTASGHTFNRAGARPISVDITDSGDTTTLSTASGTAAITSAGVTVTGGSINATQGADFTGTVGTFSDSYTSTTTPANAYTATITWDNTSSTTGTVTSLGNGQYSIAADHTFQTAGDVSYSISVAGPGMAESAADTGAANVTSAAVTATIAPVSTTEGTPWSGTIATFSNADSSALNAGSDYTATITWDSTSSTTGTVTSLGNGEYAVTSTHTFNNPGTPTESISIAGPGLGAAATASSTATIANAGVTVSGGSITATQGQSFTSTVGTLSDSNINTTGPANAYAATITWASGSTSAGTITSLGGGTYSISATDTLQKGGLQSYAISVTGPGMASAATGTGSVTVTNAGISSGAFGISATEGSAFSGAVVSFTNNDTSATDLGTDYSASIHWGDGIITTGTVAATGNGGYTISGSHQYDTAGSSTPMFVVVAGAGLASPVTINGTANVASAGVTATLATMTSTEGQVFSSTVATFTDADPNTTTPASSYAATITWPGNVTSSGTITAGTSGSYTVTGSNTFNHAGPQPVSISITGPGMASPATASGNASISTAGLAATLSTITASEGGTFTGTLATFTDADANTTSITSDYSAAVAWNGGNPVAGTIVALGNGQFAVTGSETFTAAGTPTVGISITGPGGGLAFASGSASVSSGTLSAAASPITAAEGVAYSGTIATFSDAYTGTTTPANAFTATITWGDNASSTGTVTSLGNGQFAITSAHTYTAPGSPTVGVSITGPGSGSATASTTATVSAAAITASTASISSTEGLTWSGTVATIHSADAASTVTAGQYSATITWPDNTQSSGTVTAQGGGV
jgi:hypothetical protein